MHSFLQLAAAEGCGPGMVTGLLDPELTPETAWQHPPQLPPAAAARLRDPQLPARAADWEQKAVSLGLSVLTPTHPLYPEQLRAAPLRPNALFARGDASIFNHGSTTVTIVGSRTLTPYGDAAARDFATVLAQAGIVIASGLAYGIDRIAHEAAVAAGTPTIAVLAGGLDQIYPPSHADLAREIVAKGGLLVSEIPVGVRARRGHFPRRNRILAGSAHAVLVIEAGLRSGSLHTARFASDYGVPVFAVPGPYTSPRSRGCHAILASGAQIATCPDEFLRDLGVQESLRVPEEDQRAFEASADEAIILRLLQPGPRPVDLLARESALSELAFLEALAQLKSRGLVRQMPGDLLSLGPPPASR